MNASPGNVHGVVRHSFHHAPQDSYSKADGPSLESHP